MENSLKRCLVLRPHSLQTVHHLNRIPLVELCSKQWRSELLHTCTKNSMMQHFECNTNITGSPGTVNFQDPPPKNIQVYIVLFRAPLREALRAWQTPYSPLSLHHWPEDCISQCMLDMITHCKVITALKVHQFPMELHIFALFHVCER